MAFSAISQPIVPSPSTSTAVGKVVRNGTAPTVLEGEREREGEREGERELVLLYLDETL